MSDSAPAAVTEDEQQRRALRRVGSMLSDKWRLDALIGVGGMAAVYAATHRNGKRVALKILHPELSHHREARERFIEEAYVANRVGHPGVVSVLDDGNTEDGSAFLVMDLLDGETADARLARSGGKLKEAEVLSVADQLLDAMIAAHAVGVIHRDIKPENVFITREGKVKLLDFGIARIAESRRTTRTQVGSTMGTPAFMAPEQARGRWEEIDARTDIWALGATLFVLLTGRLVHDAETTNEELLAAMTRPAPKIQSASADVTDKVAEVIDTALEFERDRRFADAREMQRAVREAYASMSAPETLPVSLATVSSLPPAGVRLDRPSQITTYRPVTTTAQPVAEVAQPRTRRLGLVALASGVLAITLAGLFRFSMAPPPSEQQPVPATASDRNPSDSVLLPDSPVASDGATPVAPEGEHTQTDVESRTEADAESTATGFHSAEKLPPAVRKGKPLSAKPGDAAALGTKANPPKEEPTTGASLKGDDTERGSSSALPSKPVDPLSRRK